MPATGELTAAYLVEVVDETGEALTGAYTLCAVDQRRDGELSGGAIEIADLPPTDATLEPRDLQKRA